MTNPNQLPFQELDQGPQLAPEIDVNEQAAAIGANADRRLAEGQDPMASYDARQEAIAADHIGDPWYGDPTPARSVEQGAPAIVSPTPLRPKTSKPRFPRPPKIQPLTLPQAQKLAQRGLTTEELNQKREVYRQGVAEAREALRRVTEE